MKIKNGVYTIDFLDGTTKEFESLEGADLEGADLYRVDLEGVNLKGASLEKADLRGAILRGANLYRVNLINVNLCKADLEGASLKGAYLYRANLYRANLINANLINASLRGADLTFCKGVIGFYLGMDFGFMTLHNQYVQIGCECGTLNYWLNNYKEIGQTNDYTEQQIHAYGAQLKMLKEVCGGKK